MKTALLALVAVTTPAVAQTVERRAEKPVTIVMTDEGFAPRNVTLQRGHPYVLNLVNRSTKGHNLTQRAFFDAALVRGDDRRWVADGQIVLAAGERARVHFRAPSTRSGGSFEFSSTTLGDADKDYKGFFHIR